MKRLFAVSEMTGKVMFFIVKDDCPDGGSEDEVLLGSQITGYDTL